MSVAEVSEVSIEWLEDWMVGYLSKLLGVPEDEIDVSAHFQTMGLDSSSSVGITGDLSDAIGIKLDESLMFNYPTVEKVTNHVMTLV